MVLVQIWPLIHLFFFGNIGEENAFYDVIEQKRPLYAIKTRSPKVEKLRNGIFLSFS